MSKQIGVCDYCGSKEVEYKAWVDWNTDQVKGECSTDVLEDGWCRDCGVHCLIKIVDKDE